MKRLTTSVIKRIPEKDLAVFVDIVAAAYPGMNIRKPDDKKGMVQRLRKASRDPQTEFIGLYRKRKLQGGMALYDFTMNFHSIMMLIGGVGLVAVDLVHKKEHVCKELIQYFHGLYRSKKASITALYPFRPDFYRKMGYGFGTKMNQYYFRPTDIVYHGSKKNVRYMISRDRRGIKACYTRNHTLHHGMLTEREAKWRYMFSSPAVKVVVFHLHNRISGYLAFSFRKVQEANWIKSDLVIHDFVWESREAFHALLCFLHTQSDQIHRIVYDTQDDTFHHMLFDPRNGTDCLFVLLAHEVNVAGVGIMYRVIDTRKLFTMLRGHDFNGVTCAVKLTLDDSFLPENSGSMVVSFKNGTPHAVNADTGEVEISMSIADFSSMIMGVLDIKDLYMYGLVDISKPRYLDTLNRLFHSPVKPITTTQF